MKLLVQRALEDESDAAGLCAQRLDAERAGGVEGVRAVRQRDLTPERRRLLRADVTAGDEGVGGGLRVHVEAGLAAQPQRHVGAPRPAHGALSLLTLRVHLGVTTPPPAVVAVHVAAAQVGPGLLLVRDVFAAKAGEGQRVEADRTLRPPGVQLLPQGLQVFDGGGVRQTFSRPPQQGGAAQVDERAVHQLVTLRVHLEERRAGYRSNTTTQTPQVKGTKQNLLLRVCPSKQNSRFYFYTFKYFSF